MGITLAQWDEEAKTLTPNNAQKVADAIRTLESTVAIKEQFGWTGLFALKYTYQARADRGLIREQEKW